MLRVILVSLFFLVGSNTAYSDSTLSKEVAPVVDTKTQSSSALLEDLVEKYGAENIKELSDKDTEELIAGRSYWSVAGGGLTIIYLAGLVALIVYANS